MKCFNNFLLTLKNIVNGNSKSAILIFTKPLKQTSHRKKSTFEYSYLITILNQIITIISFRKLDIIN